MKKSEVLILIVDDDASMQSALTEFLKKLGYKALAVGRVDEALNMVKLKPVNMAIIDCMLPKMNGIDLANEFRTSRFQDNPIILMSGIFKDKSFAGDALKKTKAVGFINKPFNLEELKNLIEKNLTLRSEEEVRLTSLISKHNSSPREQLKWVEKMEEIKGDELPLVTSVLMAGDFSGYLNLVGGAEGEDQDILGITFKKGEVIKVDGSRSKQVFERIIVELGILTTQELSDHKAQYPKGDLLANLVEANLLSPHLISNIRNRQVVAELIDIYAGDNYQLNLAPDRIRGHGAEVGPSEMINVYEKTVRKMDYNYLKSFYSLWIEFPIRKSPTFTENHAVLKSSLLKGKVDVIPLLESDKSLKILLGESKFTEEEFYKALHLLVLTRLIYFEDVQVNQSFEEYASRLQTIYDDIMDKNPIDIYLYFGASSSVKPSEVERIYKEFAKSNHPDSLPPNAPEDVRKVVTQVFSLVSSACDTLVDDEKRTQLFNSIKQKEAVEQMQAENLAEEGLNHLRKGRVGVALPKLRQAFELYSSSNLLIYMCWGELKALEGKQHPAKLLEITKHLESVPIEDRRTPQFQLVQGLLKKAEGDYDGAYAYFDKSLALDAAFLDARREIASLGSSKRMNKRGSAMDLLTGDISELTSTISSFFKKKA